MKKQQKKSKKANRVNIKSKVGSTNLVKVARGKRFCDAATSCDYLSLLVRELTTIQPQKLIILSLLVRELENHTTLEKEAERGIKRAPRVSYLISRHPCLGIPALAPLI